MIIRKVARSVAKTANLRWFLGVLIVLIISLVSLFGIKGSLEEPAQKALVGGKSGVSEVSEISSEDLPVSSGSAFVTPQTSALVKSDLAKYYERQNIWLTVALLSMAIATILSICISFYLYRWRKILLSSPHMLVPEEFGSLIRDLQNGIEHFAHSVKSGFEKVDGRSASTEEKVSNLVETFMTMRNALDERDAEIRRLKRGYDAEIFKRFVGRFIRVDRAIEDIQRGGQVTPESLDQIKIVLEDAFAECGVESFIPPVGADYRTTQGVADNPRLIVPDCPEDTFKIADVLDAGYHLKTPDGWEIIVPAKVSVYGTKG